MKERRSRSVLKTISYRISSSIITGLIVYIFTKEIIISLSVGALDITLKTIWYYTHERVWNKVDWGKNNHCKKNSKKK
tara:strand:- start:41 stop:274 length:234 start_codon:yes stop_codon:yes gene_type:complete